jgi:hypothetical protein
MVCYIILREDCSSDNNIRCCHLKKGSPRTMLVYAVSF